MPPFFHKEAMRHFIKVRVMPILNDSRTLTSNKEIFTKLSDNFSLLPTISDVMIIVYPQKSDSKTAVKFSCFMHYFKIWSLRMLLKFDTDGL